MVELLEKDGAVTFRIHVQPRASKSELAGEHGGAFKLRIAAPPVDGKANEECRRLLARLVGVSLSSIQIVVGESSKDKVVRVHDVTAARIRELLTSAAEKLR